MAAPQKPSQRPAVLCILDGWGWRPEKRDNAIAAAVTPNYSRMLADSPYALLHTSGRAVGLPEGQMGNSEVGHMNIGAGRVVQQDLPRIGDAIADGSIACRPALQDLVAKAKAARGAVHLMGLLSPGGVHSHQDHIAALARVLAKDGLKVHVHAFLDGRDTPPQSALGFVKKFEMALSDLRTSASPPSAGAITRWTATSAGTGSARPMARSCRQKARVRTARTRRSRRRTRTASPTNSCCPARSATLPARRTAMRCCSRTSAPIAHARFPNPCSIPHSKDFARPRVVKFSAAAGLTEYSDKLARLMGALFPPEDIRETLGEYVSRLGLRQLRVAETEKYAHVTFFLNGGREGEFPGEDRALIPSPKVATYDSKPEMSAPEVTKTLETAIAAGKYDLIVVNFANPDMVGHTGVMKAAIEAVDVIDDCLGRLRSAVEKAGGVLLITADHGNIEMMKDPVTGEPHTAHTTLDVPIIAVNAKREVRLTNGRLADVAPTLLDLMGLKKPAAMTGHSLIAPLNAVTESVA